VVKAVKVAMSPTPVMAMAETTPRQSESGSIERSDTVNLVRRRPAGRRRSHDSAGLEDMTTTAFTAKDVQELRQRTGAGMMECKRALEDAKGDIEKAAEALRTKGIAKADKRVGKTTSEGLVSSYIHHNGKVGVLLEINCETDFVARTDDFKTLAREIALHIASMAPLAVDKSGVPAEAVEKERRIFAEQARQSGKPEQIIAKMIEGKVESYYKDVALLSQAWVKEPKKTVGDLVKETSAKVGENIQVRRFVRYQLGEA
jgi:elongation factor Ts